MNCNSMTKNNLPCKMRVSNDSELFNGMRLCHIHLKSMKNQQQIVTFNINPDNIHRDSSDITNRNQINTNNTTLINTNNTRLQTNIPRNTVRCTSKTKAGCRCSKKTSDESHLCHIHQTQIQSHKPININKQNNENNVNNENDVNVITSQLISLIKSPCINYKTNIKYDNCYVCLENSETKLSCGHFIHTNCMIETLLSNLKKNYRVFEHKQQYFIITNCMYCKQIAIMKNIPMTEKLQYKYDTKKNKMKINNITLSFYFTELFLRYDTYDTKQYQDTNEIEFMEELKQLIFDNFATIVFDNYIQQKNINKIPSRYERIQKRIIMDNIQNCVDNTLYTKSLFDKIKSKLELFFRIFENVIDKMIDCDNVQDDILSLVNVF